MFWWFFRWNVWVLLKAWSLGAEGHSDNPSDLFLNVCHANYASAYTGPHLKTHLRMMMGIYWEGSSQASGASEDGDHAVWPHPSCCKASLHAIIGACWSSLGNPTLTALHGGACVPQQALAGRESLGCRAGVFWIRETSRWTCLLLQPGTTCIISSALVTCRVTS